MYMKTLFKEEAYEEIYLKWINQAKTLKQIGAKCNTNT